MTRDADIWAERTAVADQLVEWAIALEAATKLRAQRITEGKPDLVAELDVALSQIRSHLECLGDRLLQLAAACDAGHA